MSIPERYRGTKWPYSIDLDKPKYLYRLRHILRKVGMDPMRVRTALELGPGSGRMSGIIVAALPHATLHTIDFYPDDMTADLQRHERIVRHGGLFVDVLRKGIGVPPDITILSFSSPAHGFTADTIDVLAQTVGRGVLLTNGDNGELEQTDYFLDRFIRERTDGSTVIWNAQSAEFSY